MKDSASSQRVYAILVVKILLHPWRVLKIWKIGWLLISTGSIYSKLIEGTVNFV